MIINPKNNKPSTEDEIAQLKNVIQILAQNNNAMAQLINNISWAIEYILKKLEAAEMADKKELEEYIKHKAEEFRKQIEEAMSKPELLIAEVGTTPPKPPIKLPNEDKN